MVTGLKHQKEKRSMDHFAGLDCIVDDTGRIVREVKVASEPKAGMGPPREMSLCGNGIVDS